MRRAINADGLALIKSSEGCRLSAYVCPAGVLTIGYGSTGPHVKPGMTITQAQADDLLRSDLRRFEDAVTEHGGTCTDNQFAALTSFAFNLGESAFENSTLLNLHRQGKYGAAQAQFGLWTHGGGKILPGLVRRRAAEAALYGKAS